MIKCDVTIESDVKSAMDQTIAKWGTVHAVLTAAGVNWPMITLTKKSSIDMERFKKIMDINLMGSMYVAKYASIAMSKNEGDEKGAIIFVSSVAAEEG